MATFKAAFLYWKLAIFRITGKALMAAAVSVVTTLNGAEWGQFTSTQKFVALVTALSAMWMVIDAFLDSTMGELRKENDTTFLHKHRE